MHFVSQITLPPSEASRVTVTRVFQQPASDVDAGDGRVRPGEVAAFEQQV
jgi:hypothetical protein